MLLKTVRSLARESYAVFLPLALILFLYSSGYAFINTSEEGVCTQDSENSSQCEDSLKIPDAGNALTSPGEQKAPERKPVTKDQKIQKKSSHDHSISSPETSGKTDIALSKTGSGIAEKRIVIYLFWGKGCPHCAEEKIFLQGLKKAYTGLIIKDYEVWYNKENASLLSKMVTAYGLKTSGVPVTFIDRNAFIGFSRQNREEITDFLHRCSLTECVDPSLIGSGEISSHIVKNSPLTGSSGELACKQKSNSVYIPWLGNLDASEMSLPVITLIIAGLDSFNPCAFFVLFSLLGLLIHAQSRTKMFFIGSIFVMFSGLIYFLFMAAWLNLFLFMGQVKIITLIAGSVALVFALINIKDFFIFKKGVSLTIPDGAKPKLFDRMRRLLKSTSFLSILIGTAVLAVAANSYELLCTAGFPMVFTRILTLNELAPFTYYLYLVLYNIIYIVPLAVIVVIFTITLGKRQLTEWQGRILKLVSGTMMLALGGALIIDPEILSNAFVSFFLIIGALFISVIVIFLTKRLR
jgi:thiol-disulfide isomerase/thioredoxin